MESLRQTPPGVSMIADRFTFHNGSSPVNVVHAALVWVIGASVSFSM